MLALDPLVFCDGLAEHVIGSGRYEEVKVIRRKLDALACFDLPREAAVEVGKRRHYDASHPRIAGPCTS